jgi:hypothetical protein
MGILPTELINVVVFDKAIHYRLFFSTLRWNRFFDISFKILPFKVSDSNL